MEDLKKNLVHILEILEPIFKEHTGLTRFLEEKAIVKVIVVPGKLVNIVVK